LGLAVIAVFGFLYFRKGTAVPVDTSGPGTNFISQFNSFGNNKTTPPVVTPGVNTGENQPAPTAEVPTGKLIKISSMPIAGFTAFMKERLKDVPIIPQTPATPPETGIKKTTTKPTPPPTEFALALRYVERATGNIYQTFVDKIAERKFSSTIIPKIYDAYFGNHGESVVMRHLKTNDRTIETFASNLPKEKLGEDATTNDVKGSFLVDDIKDVSVSPDGTKMFYLFSNGSLGDSAIGTIFNLSDSKKTQVFDSAFTEWLSFWPSSKTITLTTKPSGAVPGFMYMIDVDKKNLTKVLSDINGLTTQMSPNGKLVLYGNNSLSLSVYHTDTKVFESLGVNTLPEKCIWNNTSEFVYCAVPASPAGAKYPDDWYQGAVSFSDQIWKINIQNGTAVMIADPVTMAGGGNIDGIKLALYADESYLFFINKKDSFLWKLNLK